MSKIAGKAVVCTIGGLLTGLAASGQSLPDLLPLPNGSGFLETRNAGGGPIDLTGPFFQSLGTNGRSWACPPWTHLEHSSYPAGIPLEPHPRVHRHKRTQGKSNGKRQ